MKRACLLLTAMLMGAILSGCGKTDSNTDHQTAPAKASRAQAPSAPFAKVVTFKTAEPAPADFERWSLLGQTPSVWDPEAKIDFVVTQPDGKEYAQLNIGQLSATKISRFGREMAGGDPSVFYSQHIRYQFRAEKGRLVFPADENAFHFFFFKKGAAGKVDWEKPFQVVKAIVEPTSAADQAHSQVVTFKTAEPAPASFDGWQFSWLTPSCYEADAPIDFVVLDPSGKAYFQLDLTGKIVTPTTSDFKAGLLGGDPAVFFNQTIRFSYRTTKGDLVFPNPQAIKFAFYRKQSPGNLQVIQPFKLIDAVMEVTASDDNTK